MYSLPLLCGADPNLGRVDYSSLTDQSLMEMLVDGFDGETKKKYQDSEGTYLDVCAWPCIRCDDEERVIEIDINSENVSGSLELCYVPPKVEDLKVSPLSGESRMTGSVDFARLPDGMKYLHLSNNQLTGEIDLTQPPKGLERVSLEDNQLTGEIDLTQLPDGMVYLSLKNNQLTGEVNLTQLPDGMVFLDLRNNRLTGEIDLTQLPDIMNYAHLENNQLTGEVNLTQLPSRMHSLDLSGNQLTGSLIIRNIPLGAEEIDVRGNHFNAVAVVDSETHDPVDFEGSGVTSVVDENGKELDIQQFLG